jgi:tetratricopeptide (TPR) repeat protein
MFEQAIAEYQEATKARDGNSQDVEALLGAVYAKAGERARAEDILKKLKSGGTEVAPRSLAILYAALGMGDEAFMQFEKAFVEATHTCLSSPLNRHTTICVQTRAFRIYCGG